MSKNNKWKEDPPPYIWLQIYDSGSPAITWTSLGFLSEPLDIKYIREDLIDGTYSSTTNNTSR